MESANVAACATSHKPWLPRRLRHRRHHRRYAVSGGTGCGLARAVPHQGIPLTAVASRSCATRRWCRTLQPCENASKRTGIYCCGAPRPPTVEAARLEVLARLAARGYVKQPRSPTRHRASTVTTARRNQPLPEVTVDNTAMHEVLPGGAMISLFERLLEGEIRCFDYTWFRVKTPVETAATPHCDSIYMGAPIVHTRHGSRCNFYTEPYSG